MNPGGNHRFLLELFGPSPNATPKVNISIFNRPNTTERTKWVRDIDFLFSCIGFCVGLGNIWRFPFVAFENDGGTFIFAYLLALIFIGIPILYLEIIIGQFTSRSGARIFDCAPILRGIGYGQGIITVMVGTYYSAIASIAAKYLFSSFTAKLPWCVCKEKWNASCVSSTINESVIFTTRKRSSELYFREVVMKPVLDATFEVFNFEIIIYLAVCWILVSIIMVKDLRISSNLGCFLVFGVFAIFIVLLSQELVTPGGIDGAVYFVKPVWNKLLNLQIWYAAITQVFYSLGICFGPIMMYASFNRFNHSICKVVPIIISVNITTSILAGSTFFAAVGIVARSNGLKFTNYTNGFSHNTFIIYSDVIAKFEYLPQITSAFLFLIFTMSGIGCISGLVSFFVKMIQDEFRIMENWKIVIPIGILGFIGSTIYFTPPGKFILIEMDFFGVSFPAFFIAILEIILFAWVYGAKRVYDDTEFMYGSKMPLFWRILWIYKIPIELIVVFVHYSIYHALQMTSSNNANYSTRAYVIGWSLLGIIVIIIGIWTLYVLNKLPKVSLRKKMLLAFGPEPNWGPSENSLLLKYRCFILKKENNRT